MATSMEVTAQPDGGPAADVAEAQAALAEKGETQANAQPGSGPAADTAEAQAALAKTRETQANAQPASGPAADTACAANNLDADTDRADSPDTTKKRGRLGPAETR